MHLSFLFLFLKDELSREEKNKGIKARGCCFNYTFYDTEI